MKPSTLTANQHLADAIESLDKAKRSLQLTMEQGPCWLGMDTLSSIKRAKAAAQGASAHVSELLECEDAE